MYLGIKKPQADLEEKASDFKIRVIDWMQLMQGAILSTQPELDYVAEIIAKSRDEIEKANGQLKTEEIAKVVERVEIALSYAESQAEHKRDIEVEQLNSRSLIMSRLEDDEVNLARTRIENRMFRAPIIIVPFTLLIVAFGLAVLGVIEIRGQKIDVDNIVNKAVQRLIQKVDTEGDRALAAIKNKLVDKTKEISEFDVNMRIENEISLHVADKGKNTLVQITSKLNQFNKNFPDQTLTKTIQSVQDTERSASSLKTRLEKLESKLAQLNKDVLPFIRKLDKQNEETTPTKFEDMRAIIQHSLLGFYIGMIGWIMGVISFLLGITLWFKHR